MAYTQQSWVDGPSGGTPLSAARLLHMESGIGTADTQATTNATAISTHIGNATGAHAASAISFSNSGLLIVTGTNVQTAIAQLDSAVASAQIVEGGYVENDTAKPGGANAGVSQVLSLDPPQDLNLMVLSIPQSTRPIYVTGRAVFDVTAAPASAKSGNCQLVITDDTNTDLEQAMFPIESGGGTGGYASALVQYRIPPNTPARTYRLQASYSRGGGDTLFTANVMHGNLAAAFRTWMKWEYR